MLTYIETRELKERRQIVFDSISNSAQYLKRRCISLCLNLRQIIHTSFDDTINLTKETCSEIVDTENRCTVFRCKPHFYDMTVSLVFTNIPCFWQVGVMLLGTQVKNCLIGGPAFGRLQKGDVIVKIDGRDVNEHNILPYLLGSDVPGSQVMITVQRTNTNSMGNLGSEYCVLSSSRAQVDVLDIDLIRISTEEIADLRRMFDLFTYLEVGPRDQFKFEMSILASEISCRERTGQLPTTTARPTLQ
jgi:hypothetical protein